MRWIHKNKATRKSLCREGWREIKQLPCLHFTKPRNFAGGCCALPESTGPACSPTAPPGRAQHPALHSVTFGRQAGAKGLQQPVRKLCFPAAEEDLGHEPPEATKTSQRCWHLSVPLHAQLQWSAFTHKVHFKLRLYIRPFLPGTRVCVSHSTQSHLFQHFSGLLPQIWLKLESICYTAMMEGGSGFLSL